MKGVLSLTTFAIGEPAAHLAAASICKSFCAAAYPARLAATCERQSYHLWKQLLFELLTDIISC
jgi:hypothetical protein